MTKYEKEIYHIITASVEHLTVEQIFTELKEKYPKVVIATVYNNVNKLWSDGMIRRISVENMPDRYDRTERHDHLVCQRCGKLTDILFDDLADSLQEKIDGDILRYDLKVYYLCAVCREKEDCGHL